MKNDKIYGQLLSSAKKYLKRAHSPYSRVQVACAVLADNNRIYSGCNIENASYGATICAERVAITKAISEGALKIKALLIITNQPTIWPPCGMCRQVISEFSLKTTIVYCCDRKKNYIKSNFSDLFPSAFSSSYLS